MGEAGRAREEGRCFASCFSEGVSGWHKGDHVFLTGTTRQNKIAKTFKPTVRQGTETEERIITDIKDSAVTLDKPLEFNHIAEGAYRGEIANLSRNVIVESADEGNKRGHTMYHRNSSGLDQLHAEFRHLGKEEGVLGRYSSPLSFGTRYRDARRRLRHRRERLGQ